MKTRLLALLPIALLTTTLPGLARAHSTGGVPHSHEAASWASFFMAMAAGYLAWCVVQAVTQRRTERRARAVRVKSRP